MKAPKKKLSLVERLLREIRADRERERLQAAEELHNRLVDVINENPPSVETLLYVLEMIKAATLSKQNDRVFKAPGGEAKLKPAALSHSKSEPSAIGIAAI